MDPSLRLRGSDETVALRETITYVRETTSATYVRETITYARITITYVRDAIFFAWQQYTSVLFLPTSVKKKIHKENNKCGRRSCLARDIIVSVGKCALWCVLYRSVKFNPDE